mgnify:CR=1 FL=1
MFNLDEDSKIKIEVVNNKIKLTIKIKKGIDKFLHLSFDIEPEVADKIISELVSIRAKL